jgi:hypothetical protein
MEMVKLQEYYNKIDSCSVALSSEVDFEYIQNQITQVAMYTEDLNRVIGEILVEQTRLEHKITDRRFEYELKFTKYMMENAEVKSLTTAKERKDFINYFLMKEDYRTLIDLEQEEKDIEKLLDLAKKKSKDLDRTYPKLKTLWESLHSEVKNIKKIGSDMEHIDRVRNRITDGAPYIKPVFADNIVEEITSGQYDNNNDDLADFLEEEDDSSSQSISASSIENDVNDLLRDL